MVDQQRILVGKRVLVVDDDFAVAIMIEDFIEEFGGVVAETCSALAKALEAAETGTFDLAVLDVNLKGEWSYPVADVLERRGVPFLFVSGYGDRAIPDEHRNWKVCAKPFRGDDLAAVLVEVLNDGR